MADAAAATEATKRNDLTGSKHNAAFDGFEK